MPPRKIAEAIFNELQLQGSSFEKAEIAWPGFMNFFLKRQWFSKTVQTVLAEGDAIDRPDIIALAPLPLFEVE